MEAADPHGLNSGFGGAVAVAESTGGIPSVASQLDMGLLAW